MMPGWFVIEGRFISPYGNPDSAVQQCWQCHNRHNYDDPAKIVSDPMAIVIGPEKSGIAVSPGKPRVSADIPKMYKTREQALLELEWRVYQHFDERLRALRAANKPAVVKRKTKPSRTKSRCRVRRVA